VLPALVFANDAWCRLGSREDTFADTYASRIVRAKEEDAHMVRRSGELTEGRSCQTPQLGSICARSWRELANIYLVIGVPSLEDVPQGAATGHSRSSRRHRSAGTAVPLVSRCGRTPATALTSAARLPIETEVRTNQG